MELNNSSVDIGQECNRLARIISGWEGEQLKAKEVLNTAVYILARPR